MKLRRKLSLAVAGALVAATAVVAGVASPALAAGKIIQFGPCGDQLVLRVKTPGDPLQVSVIIPSTDRTEQWTLTIAQQDYSAVTGGRLGSPVDQTSNFPPLVFNALEGGFASDGGQVNNSPGLTHGFSYTATRVNPPLTCTNEGFWTNPGGSTDGPTGENPAARPDVAPKFAGESEADQGTNDALLLMDQEMQAGPTGIPAGNRFQVLVNGVARAVTVVQIFNDDPPNQAILDLTFDGAAVAATDTITVRYTRPLIGTQAALQDLEALKTASFGPVPIAVV